MRMDDYYEYDYEADGHPGCESSDLSQCDHEPGDFTSAYGDE